MDGLTSDHVKKMLLNMEMEISPATVQTSESANMAGLVAEVAALRAELSRKFCKFCQKEGNIEESCFKKHTDKRPSWYKAANKTTENSHYETGATFV
jgi:hypothetical protein